jgi:hypothetical protein
MNKLEQLEQALAAATEKLEASPKYKAWEAADKAYKAAIETRHPDQRVLCEAFWNALEKLRVTPKWKAWENAQESLLECIGKSGGKQ